MTLFCDRIGIYKITRSKSQIQKLKYINQILLYIHSREEWPSELSCYIKNQKDPGSTPTRCSAGLWDQPCYKAPGDLQVKIFQKHND